MVEEKQKDKYEHIKPVFLSEGDVTCWERPSKIQRNNRFTLPSGIRPNASTELIKPLGISSLKESVGPYELQAHAAVYLAMVALLGKQKVIHVAEKPSNKPREMVLFDGEISFFERGKIPGTDLKGAHYIRSGGIWVARKPSEEIRGSGGLRKVIFDSASTDEERLERVLGIIRGYEDLELAEHDAEIERSCSEYMRGARDNHESTFGTFSRVPFRGGL